MSGPAICHELQQLFADRLPSLVEVGVKLMRTLPQKKPKIAHVVFVSLAQRLFLLLEDIHSSFATKLGNGYFTTAILTRGLMEAATILLVLNKDHTGELLSAFIEAGAHESQRRRNGLAKMQRAKNPEIATAAQNETRLADGIVAALQKIATHAALPKAHKRFPKMEERCSILGEHWQFMYEATYRELCEAVHGTFLKIPHAPSLAFRASDEGAAILYEHCRATSYAVEFWGVTILEMAEQHPDTTSVETFQRMLEELFGKGATIQNQFSPDTISHKISF